MKILLNSHNDFNKIIVQCQNSFSIQNNLDFFPSYTFSESMGEKNSVILFILLKVCRVQTQLP